MPAPPHEQELNLIYRGLLRFRKRLWLQPERIQHTFEDHGDEAFGGLHAREARIGVLQLAAQRDGNRMRVIVEYRKCAEADPDNADADDVYNTEVSYDLDMFEAHVDLLLEEDARQTTLKIRLLNFMDELIVKAQRAAQRE